MGVVADKALAQRRAALLIGNRVRYDNALLKAEVAELDHVSGLRYVALIVRESKGRASSQSLRVNQLLSSVSYLGEKSVNRMLIRSQIAHGRKIGQLSRRQRELLAGLLERRADDKQQRGATDGC